MEEKLNPKVGDTVLVRGKVIGLTNYVMVKFDGGQVYVPFKAIASIEPRPLKVGDVVRFKNPNAVSDLAEIVAIVDNQAWIRFSTGGCSISYLSELIVFIIKGE